MSDIRVIVAHWQNPLEQQALKEIREQVFMQEQGVSAELEWDGLDDTAVHFLALNRQQRAVACARLLADGHIGRMAVLKQWRARGIGKSVMQAVIDYAHQYAYPSLFLDAQARAIGFYESFGFQVEGEEYLDANIPHLTMRLQQ